MSVSSITSTNAASLIQKPPAPEALESRRVGPDHDGDADDRVGAGNAPKPVVNTSGQTTGLMVNDRA